MRLVASVRVTLAAVCLLLMVTAAFFWPLLSGPRVLFYGDIALYFVPLLHFARVTLQTGHLPLWNPYLLCGTPFVGDPQAWHFYPSWLLLYAVPAEMATGLIGAGHCFFAALGTLLFLRRRGIGTGGSLLAAIAWGMGGALVSKMQFPNMVQAAAYLPYLLWAAEGLLLAPRPSRAALLGLLIGLALLAAHAQMFLMELYVLLAWALWRGKSLPPAARRRCALLLIGGLGLGALLAMGELLPVLEMTRVSVRPDLKLAQANRFILPPYAAPTNFLAPNFYGNPALPGGYVARGNFWEPCCYLGLLSLVLALGAAFRLWRERPEVRFWAITALVCIWLSLGRDSGLYAVAFYVLPGLSRFHDPARWLIPGTFALACLAAHGTDSLLRHLAAVPLRRVVALALLGVTAADLFAFVTLLNPTAPVGAFSAAGEGWGHPSGTSSSRFYMADERRGWGRYISYVTYDTVATDERRVAFLHSAIPNLPLLQGAPEVGGYEPICRANIKKRLTDLRERELDEPPRPPATRRTVSPSGLAPLLQAVGASAVVYLDRGGKASPYSLPVPDAPGRAFLVTAEQQRLPLKLTEVNPQEVTVLLPAGHPGGRVVLCDTDHPGWRVWVDGKTRSMQRVEDLFRGVAVEAGERAVTFRFDPDSFRVGAFVTLCAAGILMAVFTARVAAVARSRAPSSRRILPGVATK